jgi:hypothetical protein
MNPQSCKSRNVSNFRELRVPKQNAIWMQLSRVDAEYTIWGEGGGFPRVRAVGSLVSLKSFVVRPSTKGAPTMH